MSLSSMVSAPAVLLHPERHRLLEQLTEGLDASALTWLSGYAAGLAAGRGAPNAIQSLSLHQSGTGQIAAIERNDQAARATVLYASQTGNGRRIAERLARSLEALGVAVRSLSTVDYPVRELAQEKLLFLVASTHGDGDPPDDARAFCDFLFSRRAPRLERLAFSVLALGDSSYPKFCDVGRRFDEQLAALGARRLGPRVDCDVDYETAANSWSQIASDAARSELQAPRLAVVTALRSPHALANREATREQPFEAEVLVHQRISARDSDKRVIHIELAAPAQRLPYEPGDAVGIWQKNPPESVSRILELLALNADAAVTHAGVTHSLQHWLTNDREITRLTRPFLEAHAERSGNAVLQNALKSANSAQLRTLLKDWQPADLLKRAKGSWSAGELVAALRPSTPRLYSIASSRREVGDELHLTVAAVDYEFDGERRYGAASQYLSALDLSSLNKTGDALISVRAYIEPNTRFRLPVDGDRHVIMIGPGTGVAPFRAFVQDRAASGARGQNWLFFGGRHLSSDFLYQTEWLDARKRGSLQRLDVAFSRDQAQKIYVQDRLRSQAADVYRWLQDGAHLYVCGDAEHMAPDVQSALVDVIASQGALDREAAEAYLANLATERRYVRDVY